MPTITGHLGTTPYATDLRTEGGHTFRADEPLDEGGQNQGPTPSELLAAALTACTCITLRMYADRKGWPLEAVDAHVGFERAEDHVVRRLTRQLILRGPLTDEQRQRLVQVANACPIHKALTAGVAIDTTLAP